MVMNWRPPEGKLTVVRRYLTSSFPGTVVTDDMDFDTVSQFFNVREKELVRYRGAISREVFDDFTDGEIYQLLVTHHLAERMRQAAPNRVTLTKSGIR